MRGVPTVVEQGRDQPVAVADPGAVGASDHEVGLDDSHRQPVQVGPVGAIGKMLEHGRVAGRLRAHQQARPGLGELGQEPGRVERAVH